MRVAGTEVGIAAASELQGLAASRPARREDGAHEGEERWSWNASVGEIIRFDRIFAGFTSRDVASPAKAARNHLASTRAGGFAAAVAAHVDASRRKWEAMEVRVVEDEEAQRALRFASYHLIAAANPVDERVSISARGLTGEAYRGRVFWDTTRCRVSAPTDTRSRSAMSIMRCRPRRRSSASRSRRGRSWWAPSRVPHAGL
jgi:trehalose/maltose hydrolase-like predicted phosphorylase